MTYGDPAPNYFRISALDARIEMLEVRLAAADARIAELERERSMRPAAPLPNVNPNWQPGTIQPWQQFPYTVTNSTGNNLHIQKILPEDPPESIPA